MEKIKLFFKIFETLFKFLAKKSYQNFYILLQSWSS